MLQTREECIEWTKSLLDPLGRYTSAGGARIRIYGGGAIFDDIAADFEGFARPLWALVPLLVNDDHYPQWTRWLAGLRSGVDPEQPNEFWGQCVANDQRYVEMAALGYALCLDPSRWWHPLSNAEKTRLNEWLLQINTAPLPPQNWRCKITQVKQA